jgi:hypothetical protein
MDDTTCATGATSKVNTPPRERADAPVHGWPGRKGGNVSHAYEKDGVLFHYNGGFDGDVVITYHGPEKMTIPISAIVGFVAQYVRCERIAEIETASNSEILGIERGHHA